MTINPFLERFRHLEMMISDERGAFVLFALLMREDVPDRWDLVVSAPWAGRDKPAATAYLVDQIKRHLGQHELTSLARIVVVDPEDKAVRAFNGLIETEHSGVEVRDSDIFGLPVKAAFVITSRPLPTTAAA